MTIADASLRLDRNENLYWRPLSALKEFLEARQSGEGSA